MSAAAMSTPARSLATLHDEESFHILFSKPSHSSPRATANQNYTGQIERHAQNASSSWETRFVPSMHQSLFAPSAKLTLSKSYTQLALERT